MYVCVYQIDEETPVNYNLLYLSHLYERFTVLSRKKYLKIKFRVYVIFNIDSIQRENEK